MTTSSPTSVTTALSSVVQTMATVIEGLELKVAAVTHDRDDHRRTVANLTQHRSRLEAEIRDLREESRNRQVSEGIAEELKEHLEQARAELAARPTPAQAKKMVAERDEARAALKRAEIAQKAAEKSEGSALSDLEKAEKQLASTIGKLQETEGTLAATEERIQKLRQEIDELRTANLDLTDKVAAAPKPPQGSRPSRRRPPSTAPSSRRRKLAPPTCRAFSTLPGVTLAPPTSESSPSRPN